MNEWKSSQKRLTSLIPIWFLSLVYLIWSMTLQSKSVPTEVLCEMLGHKVLDTTIIYLDSFVSNIIDDANIFL